METIHVHEGDSDQVTLNFPEFSFEKNINAKSFKDTHGRLKAGWRLLSKPIVRWIFARSERTSPLHSDVSV